MKGERMAKRSSLGSKVRKRLSDITNTQSLPKITTHEEKSTEVSPITDNLINQLIKENTILLRHVEERNKIIELSGNELQNLRISLQKLQLQNWNLAQANSQLSAELNFGRERVKALQHELLCKDALLKSKSKEQEELNFGRERVKVLQHELLCKDALLKSKSKEQEETKDVNRTEIGGIQEGEEVDGQSFPEANADVKPCNQYRRRSTRSKSMGHSTIDRQVTEKEKPENKRRCLRRQSARFRFQEEPIENLFEIENTQLPITSEDLTCKGSSNASIESSVSNEKETVGTRNEASALQRPSIGRPSRRASAKIQSYKEIPINIKLRRAE